MSERKSEFDEDCEDYEDKDHDPDRVESPPGELPEHQYNKEELMGMSENEAAQQRPDCLDKAFDSKDGKWDPERWWYASREDSPLTVDGKERRKIEFDRDVKRKPSVNDPIERLKEDRDGIVLSPQRRSFGTGCHVQQSFPLVRQSSLTERERDREDSRGDRDRERDRDRDRNVTRKIGSGRIAIDRDGGRDFSSLRDRDRDRDRGERDIPWGRERGDRDRDREWERDRDRDDWDRDRDRRFDRDNRSDRFRRDNSDRDTYSDRNRRDFRPFDRPGRRRISEDEKEPEWFTGGPTSQSDTIELRGFESESQKRPNGLRLKRNETNDALKSTAAKKKDVAQKESSAKQIKDNSVPIEDNRPPKEEENDQVPQPLPPTQPERATIPQRLTEAQGPNRSTIPVENPDNHFDLDEFLKANLSLEAETETQGSRFSRFFHGIGANHSAGHVEDMLMPKDLLDDNNRSSPMIPSPSPRLNIGQSGKYPPGFYSTDLEQESLMKQMSSKPHPYSSGSIPNSAGDNNASAKAVFPASVTALFNRAGPAGSNASLSSNSSFSTQDAEAQLKAMLFGGPRDSASSSGTASPAASFPSIQKRIKTVAELEADMHQSSLQKPEAPPQSEQPKDMTAFNKFMIMMKAAAEANQNATQKDLPQSSAGGYGMVPSHSEFSQAVMRNKEHQMHLKQQSVNFSLDGAPTPPPQQDQSFHHHLPQQQAHLPPHLMAQGIPGQHKGPMHAMLGINPQAMSTPQVSMPQNLARQQNPSSANLSSDPIMNLIQQNPANIFASQASGMPPHARQGSPLMFSQQPPLHLNAPSPIHPSQLSPASLTNPNTRSPVLQRGLSPQELALHQQTIMQNALLKIQNERYIKKQQERVKSPTGQISVVKPQPAAQHVLPPTPQPKWMKFQGSTVNTFTPTSVLVKMHSDKAIEKEKQAHVFGDKSVEYMPSMEELSDNAMMAPAVIHANNQGPMLARGHGNSTTPPDISFLDPIIAHANQIDSSLRITSGQINILPGHLSNPMSVEEKMDLAQVAEKPGALSKMLEKAAITETNKSTTKMGLRPIVRGADQPVQEDMMSNPPPPIQQQQFHLQNMSIGRPVMGSRVMKGPAGMVPNISPTSSAPPSAVPSSSPGIPNASQMTPNKPSFGRAIVGSASSNVHPPPPMGVPPTHIHPEMLRHLEHQKQLQQHFQHTHAHTGIMIPPPPPGAIPYVAAGPPPYGVHRMPILPPAAAAANHHAMMQQHIARANSLNAARAQQQHMMAMQPPQPGPLSPVRPVVPMSVAVSGPLSPQGQQAMGSLSPAALSATIQQVSANPAKMNGPMVPPPGNVNGGAQHSVDMAAGGGGIQRWFRSDILKTQLPSMPPLPTHSSQVMTVDELERH